VVRDQIHVPADLTPLHLGGPQSRYGGVIILDTTRGLGTPSPWPSNLYVSAILGHHQVTVQLLKLPHIPMLYSFGRSLKTKHRNRLNLELALILALTKISPRIEVLACYKQAQSSH
jgi:hypothetical protein